MTVSELYNQVAQLGFEDSLESEDRFYFAANRALLQVNTVRPAIRSYTLNHSPLANLLPSSSFSPVLRTQDLCYEAIGAKAYYFEADGEGELYVEKWSDKDKKWVMIDERPLSANRMFTPYKGFVKADGNFVSDLVRLRLSGEFLYSVKNVALYRDIYSANEADIPAFEPYVRYDMSTLVSDFLSFDGPPLRENAPYETMNQGYDVEGNVLLLPYDARGSYLVRYKARPRPIVYTADAASDTELINLDEELAALLPCLVASYIWAEDEPSLAQYYLSLYREQIAIVDARAKNIAPVRVKRESGW